MGRGRDSRVSPATPGEHRCFEPGRTGSGQGSWEEGPAAPCAQDRSTSNAQPRHQGPSFPSGGKVIEAT